MIHKEHFTAEILVRSVAAINLIGNFIGVALTFVYFAVLIPRLAYGAPTGPLGSRVGFFIAVTAFVVAFVAPINIRFVWPLVREVKQRLAAGRQGVSEAGSRRGFATSGRQTHEAAC